MTTGNLKTRLDSTTDTRLITGGIATLFTLLGLVAMIAMAVYLMVRVVLIMRADYSGFDVPVTIALLFAEGFVIAHAMGYMLSIIRAVGKPRGVNAAILSAPADCPNVDVLVPARHEPREVLEKTLTALAGMTYPNKTIWLLDDSSDPAFMNEAEELAREYGAKLFRRDERHGAKAGIINDCLKNLEGEYVAIFDADQRPMPFFLNRLVPLLVANPDLAFVQTPQFYSNIDKNRVSRAAAAQQAVFYEYICEAKASSGAAFCCGTNVVFRRDALISVNGLDESSVTEDFATSIKLHEQGWKSLYYGRAYAMGMGPETLEAYFKQQFRWARGTLGVGIRLFKQFFRRPRSLSLWQWIDYSLSGSFYLVGWAYLILLLCPFIYIAFGIPSYFARPEVYFAAFLPYLTFAVLVFFGGLRQRHYTLKQIVEGQLLGFLAAPVHIRASLTALFGLKTSFGITPKGNGQTASLRAVWPQVLICALNYVVFLWGTCRFIFEGEAAAGLNAFWAGFHFAVFWSVFYFLEVSLPKPRTVATAPRLEVKPA